MNDDRPDRRRVTTMGLCALVAACVPALARADGLSPAFVDLRDTMNARLVAFRTTRAALEYARSALFAQMRTMKRGKWGWYSRHKIVHAADEAHAWGRAAVEHVFMAKAQRTADRALQFEAIAIYEAEFGDELQIARKYFG